MDPVVRERIERLEQATDLGWRFIKLLRRIDLISRAVYNDFRENKLADKYAR